MKIRIDETVAKYGFPHGSAVSSPAPISPVSVAPVGGVEHCSAPTFYSAAAFVDTWIAAPVRVAPVDYGPQYNGVGECPF